jgi:hypothetical protein
VHDLDGRGRRLTGPQVLDQGVGRDRLAVPEQQQCQEPALLAGTDLDRLAVAPNLE